MYDYMIRLWNLTSSQEIMLIVPRGTLSHTHTSMPYLGISQPSPVGRQELPSKQSMYSVRAT